MEPPAGTSAAAVPTRNARRLITGDEDIVSLLSHDYLSAYNHWSRIGRSREPVGRWTTSRLMLECRLCPTGSGAEHKRHRMDTKSTKGRYEIFFMPS